MAQRSLPNVRSYPVLPSLSPRPPLYTSPQHHSSRAQVQVQAQEEPSFLHYDHRSEVVHQAVLARHRRSVELPIKRALTTRDRDRHLMQLEARLPVT